MSYGRNYGRSGPRREQRRYPAQKKKFEEKGIVLDIVTSEMRRRRDKYKNETIIQILGTTWFTLLEIIPEDANLVNLLDEIELSRDDDNNIKAIIGRIKFEDLTPIGELQLVTSVENILESHAVRFVKWINKAGPISLRQHSLHLIKGIGPKSLGIILEERKMTPFMSYEDFEERTKIRGIKDLIKKRILEEIENEDDTHRLFTRHYSTRQP